MWIIINRRPYFPFHFSFNHILAIRQRITGGIKMIRGTTKVIVKYFDAVRGNEVGSIPAGTQITADRNQVQWLHLTSIGGTTVTREAWVSAGSTQQFISWTYAADTPPAKRVTNTITVYDDGSIDVTPA
jgi:hypothetical protein